ncbi:MAG: hypothetical protein ACQES8_02730 [Thermodesulfobacteriota bacterium]
MAEKSDLTKKDVAQCLGLAFVTVLFSLRGGEFWGAALITLRHVAAYFLFGFGLVFIFIALLNKTNLMEKFFDSKPGKVQLVKWAIGISAFLAVYQFFHVFLSALLGLSY